MTDHLMGAAEVARFLGVSRQRLAQLVATNPEFPPPEAVLAAGRIWSRQAVEAWAAAHPDRGPGRKRAEIPAPGPWPPAVEQVVRLAGAEARDLNHHWIGLDHLLLALLHADSPGTAREVLASFRVTLAEARDALVDSMGDPFEPHNRGLSIPPRTQIVLERANLKAVQLQDEEVTGEHVLLAITDYWDHFQLSAFLAERAIDAEAVRDRVVSSSGTTEADEPVPAATREKGESRARTARPPEPALAPTPAGHDPRRRRPWGSRVFTDATGRALRRGRALLQYFIDRDGNPVLTAGGRPVHLLIDDDGRPVLDEEGKPILTAVDIPPGSKVRPRPRG